MPAGGSPPRRLLPGRRERAHSTIAVASRPVCCSPLVRPGAALVFSSGQSIGRKMPPLVDSRGAGYAGLSSKRQQHENEENFLHHVTHRGDGSEAIRTQREAGLATGRAGVPAEMTTHAHGIGRRPMSAQPAHTPVFTTEALSGASITVMEPPQEHRPWRGHGRLAPAQPAAGQTHLDMTLTPRASEAPGTMRSVNHGPGTFRSTIEGAALHVTAQLPAPMASKGQGRRRMQGPPTTLAYELIHPMEATPRGALRLACHTGLEPQASRRHR